MSPTENRLVEREEITEPLLCQAAQVTESRWRTQRFPRELELQIQQNCVGLTEPQGNQNERRFENFEESRTPAYASDQHTIGCSPTTTFYRGLQIVVRGRFSTYADMLIRNQKTAIDQGLIYRVYEPTQAYIVGWVDLPVQVACIQLVLPSSSTQDLEELPSIPICLVKKHNAVRAGLFLVPVRTCWQLSCSGSKWVDLTSLEESYRPFLEEYVVPVHLMSPRPND